MAAPSNFRGFVLEKAKRSFASHDYVTAFSHYLLAIKMDHTNSMAILDEFVLCMCQWTGFLNCLDQHDEVEKAFTQATSVCKFSPDLMCALGEQALRLQKLKTAVDIMREARTSFPESLDVTEMLERVSYGVMDRWHFKMINDRERNEAYLTAIAHVIEKQNAKSVLDIGCGTGILGVFAEKSGAKHVSMCDECPVMMELCSGVIKSNVQTLPQRLSEIQLYGTRSTDLSVPDMLPERVDVVVTEIFDAALFGEHCLSTLTHAWDNLLCNDQHKKGCVIPRAAQVFFCAIECPQIRTENYVDGKNMPVLDLSSIAMLSKTMTSDDEPYTTEDLFHIRGSYKFLSPIQTLINVDFNDPQALKELSSYKSEVTLDVYAEGTVDALAVWFDLDLCEGVKVSTAPSESCCWEQAIFPVCSVRNDSARDSTLDQDGSPKVNCGDQLKVSCSLTEGCLRLSVTEIIPLGYFMKSCRISPASSVPNPLNSRNCEETRDKSSGHIYSASSLPSDFLKNSKCDDSMDNSENENKHVCKNEKDSCSVNTSSLVCKDSEDDCSLECEGSHACEKHSPLDCKGSHVCEEDTRNLGVAGKLYESENPGCQIPPQNSGENDLEHPNHNQTSCASDSAEHDYDPKSGVKNSLYAQAHHDTTDRKSHLPTPSFSRTIQFISSAEHVMEFNTRNVNDGCSVDGVELKPGVNVFQNPVSSGDDGTIPSSVSSSRTISSSVSSSWTIPSTVSSSRTIPSTVNDFQSGDTHYLNRKPLTSDVSDHVYAPGSNKKMLDVCDHVNAPSSNKMMSDCDHVHSPGSNKKSTKSAFYLHREEVRNLNDFKFHSLYVLAVHKAALAVKSPSRLIHISSKPPVNGLLALMSGFTIADLCYVGPSDKEDMENLTEKIWQKVRVRGKRWNWWEEGVGEMVEEVYEGQTELLDLVLMDTVEVNGALRSGLVDDLTALRPYVKTSAAVVPQVVDVYAVLIDSPLLLSMSCVTGDENTMGVSIAPHINPFQTRTFLDIDIHALPHHNISNVMRVFRIDLQACLAHPSDQLSTAISSAFSQSNLLRFNISNGGNVTAVVFWFDLALAPGVNASTVDPKMNWRQAAYVLGGGKVKEGEVIAVDARLEKSYLHFKLVEEEKSMYGSDLP